MGTAAWKSKKGGEESSSGPGSGKHGKVHGVYQSLDLCKEENFSQKKITKLFDKYKG